MLLEAVFLIVAAGPLGPSERVAGVVNLAGDGEAARQAMAQISRDLSQRAWSSPEPTLARAIEGAVDHRRDDALRADADAIVSAARRAYRDFRYRDALERLEAAESALRSLTPSVDTAQRLADLHLLAGEIHVDADEVPAAIESFRLAHHLDPGRRSLDPALFRPKVVALYEKVLLEAANAETSAYVVRTEPSGALVWIDGRPSGTSPYRVSLTPGDHYVAATLESHEPQVSRVRVAAQDGAELTLSLRVSPPIDALRQAQAELSVTASGAPRAREIKARILASISATALLVLAVRENERLEACVFTPTSTADDRCVPPEDAAAALDAIAAPLVVADVPKAIQSPSSEQSTPWYETWILPVSVAGLASVAAVVIVALAQHRESSYAIDRFCVGMKCSP
jgi:hypothetical protein